MTASIRRTITLCLLAIAGFFCLAWGMETLIVKEQARSLQMVADIYQRNQVDNLPDVTVTTLTGTADTTNERLLQETLTRAGQPKQLTQSMRLSGKLQLVYFQKQSNTYLAVSQVKDTLATPAAISLLSLYLATAVVLIGLDYRHRRHEAELIAQSVANLNRIRHQKQPEPVILAPRSPIYPLVEAVNRLGSEVVHLRQKVRLRQVSFDRLIDHLPLGVMLIDSDREVVLRNEVMGTLVGHPISKSRHSYVDDIKTYALARMIEHTFRSQSTHHQEITLIGTNKAVDASAVVLNPHTDHFQVLVILYDVTYLRQVEQMQLDFVGNVSHELKTPVTAISGFAETLLQGAKDDPDALEQFLTIIYQESTRLSQLITDILALSQADSQNNSVQTVHLAKLVASVEASLQQQITQKQVHVMTEIPEDLTLQIDEMRLSQIIRNLLTNAIFYNHEAGNVLISATQKSNQQVELVVQDNGIGIESDEQQRIFERFYRVDKARSRNNGGTGLGLAIVAELVAKLDGKIQVNSQLGVGTRFVITLPNE